jgi:acyl-CoA reductase-like NAD-dependent aldehyde dehydrogenase
MSDIGDNSGTVEVEENQPITRAEVLQRTKEYIQERTEELATAQIALMTANNPTAKTEQEKIIDKLNKELERAKTALANLAPPKDMDDHHRRKAVQEALR